MNNFKRDTKKLTKGIADERAVANGCRFNTTRGQHVCDWIETNLILTEGDYAGKPFKLMDWQRDCLMRLFGWEKFSEKWDRWIRRHRELRLFVSKKSGKSPMLAAIGLYLLYADSEDGQKIFVCARDAKQAGIAFGHAEQMVKRTPALDEVSKIIHSKGNERITYEARNSFIAVMCGENTKGQEGINGSILIDELHVFDAELAKVVQYAGASRSEPMRASVSTAGNDPESYGYAQYRGGLAVQNGTDNDDSLLFIDYSAPANLSEADLDANIEKYGRMANPSWGVTIDPDEFLTEYHKAKKSPADLADFKMYRLNIWQSSSSPWLPVATWQACAKPLKQADLSDRDAYGGLDLSKVNDMTAFALALPNGDETLDLHVRIWWPEANVKRWAHLYPFQKWVDEGALIVTPGDTMDYNIVRRDIFTMCKDCRVQQIGYDPMLAEDVTQQLSEGWYTNEGETINAGLGSERVAFAQTAEGMAEATEAFEGLILEKKIWHCNNPVLNWQIGHVEVKTDSNGKRRPIKPGNKPESLKKIDCTIAALFACSLAMKAKVAWIGQITYV